MPDPQQTSADAIAQKYGGVVTSDQADAIAQKYGGTSGSSTQTQPRTWTDALSDFTDDATKFLRTLVPGTSEATAAGTAMLHPGQLIKDYSSSVNAVAQKAVDAYKSGDYGQFVRHGINYLLTGAAGPVAVRADQAGDLLQQGQYARGFGASVDAATQFAAPIVAGRVASAVTTPTVTPPDSPSIAGARATPTLMKGAPPSTAAPYTPQDVIRATPYLAEEHADSPVTTVIGAREAADSAISKIEQKVSGYFNAFPNAQIQSTALAAARARLVQNARGSAVDVGMSELDDLGLDKPMSLGALDKVRSQLNAENQAQLSANQYDVSTALKADPKFAARYAAASAIRDDIYNGLDSLGVKDVRPLRQDEGSLIAVRDALQRQEFNGDKNVSGTGANTTTAKVTRAVLPMAGAAGGGYVAGPWGAAGGAATGRIIAQSVTPENLTRDALIERAFKSIGVSRPPSYPSVPPTTAPAGLLAAPATPLGSGTDPSGTGGLVSAASVLARDPVTGRFKRVFTSAAAGGGSQ
jgi:hypothetical protein